MEYYRNKTVLVTGAFGGFGRCFVSELLNRGAHLVLSDTPEQVRALSEGTLSIPGMEGGRDGQVLSIIPADLSSAEGCGVLHDEYRELGVGLDMIIRNAGIAYGGEYADIPPELNEKIVDINLLSVMRLNSLFLPEIIGRRGHVIYVSSVAGFVATPLGVAYSTSKFGVRGFAMALHGEIKKYGVRTTIAYPFFSKTSILKSRTFGNPAVSYLPGFCASSPEHVVSCTLKGAARGRLHVWPGFFSKMMWLAIRFHPVISAQRKIHGYS